MRASILRSARRGFAVAVTIGALGLSAQAQLKLPHHPKEASKPQPTGDVAPHLDCLVCGTRSYTAHVDGRKDEQGHDLVWCDTCKRDTPHSASVNTQPGIGHGNESRNTGNLRLPSRPAATNPAPAPSAPASAGSGAPSAAPSSPTSAGASAPGASAATTTPLVASEGRPDFVFAELKATRNPSPALLDRGVDSVLAAGEAGLASAREELSSPEGPIALVAGRVLVRSGSDSDFELVTARLRERTPGEAGQLIVEDATARDPVRAGPAWLASLLDSAQSSVRQTAQRLLVKSGAADIAPLLDAPAASKHVDTRMAAIEVASSIADPRATEILIAHMDDPSPRVAAGVVIALSNREDKDLDARLVGIAFHDRWLLRRGSYALLSICTREDLHLQPVLGAAHVEPLLTALDSSDAFVAGCAAVALAGIGFRSRGDTDWLDHSVVDRLVLTVSGHEFHDDLSALIDPTLRRLRLVTGQMIPPDGPRWVTWWIGAREGFHARRAELVIAPADVGSTIVRYESTGDEPEAFALVGPDAADSAESTITSGEILYLDKAQITDLVTMMSHEGLLSAEKLPGLRGMPGRGQRMLEISVRARAKDFELATGVKEPWFDRAVDACRALRDKNEWQRFPEPGRHDGALALWREQSSWWSGDHPQAERDARLKALVLGALKSGSPEQRDRGVAELEKLYTHPELVQAADYGPLMALMARETAVSDALSDRARRLGHLALVAGCRIGADDVLPDVQALELAGACAKLYGTTASGALAETLARSHRSFVRTLASDERPLIRAAVARTLAQDPKADDLAVLIHLLDDADATVETAAALSLGEHKVEAARNELLVRARVGLSPVRCASLEAIGKLGGEYVLEALIQGISDKDQTVRLAAAKGLAALADPAAVQVLISQLALVGDPDLFATARAGIVSLGAAAWPDLVRAVNQPGGNIRREAALILSEQGQPDAASPLLSILTANPKDAKVANELAILTCFDARTQPEPAQAWWAWWDGVRHDDANAWFRAALERLGLSPPPPSALTAEGTTQGRLFLVGVMARPEPWLVERARREYARLAGRDPGEIPAAGPERDAWLRALHESAAREASHG